MPRLPRLRRLRSRGVAATLSIALLTTAGLSIPVDSAVAESKTGTATSMAVSDTSLLLGQHSSVTGTLRRSDNRALIGARVLITEAPISPGTRTSTRVVATDAAGRYAASIQPVVSVIVYASFLGSPSYTPSTSAKVRVTVTERSTRSTTTSSSTYSSSSPDYVLVPLIDGVCDGWKNSLGNFGGGGFAGELIVGTVGDQAATNCKGKKKSTLDSFVGSLKDATAKLALRKALGVKENKDLFDSLTSLFKASNVSLKNATVPVQRAYRSFLRDSYNAVSSAPSHCTTLPVPQAAVCVQTLQGPLKQLFTVTSAY